MTQKRISAGNGGPAAVPVRVVLVTLDNHLASAVARAQASLAKAVPGLTLTMYAAAEWAQNQASLDACIADIGRADFVIATMLFMEEHIQAVLPALTARREACDAMVCCLSAGEVMKLTRLGGFRMDGGDTGALALLKRLRGSKKSGGNSGAGQMKMLRRLPKILKFIPGVAQDVRAYFLTLQYWLAGSDDNIAAMVRYLVGRYASADRAALKGKIEAPAPVEYPETGVYHPSLSARVSATAADLPKLANATGTVGLLLMRSYILAGNTAHYDGVIRAFEAKGLRVIPAFASGLDARPAVAAFFENSGVPAIDTLVSLTGFSLVGGPAYNDAKAAEDVLARLDVPYLAAHAVEFQTLQQWGGSSRGLMPVEATMMVAIPELDGATSPMVFGGRSDGTSAPCSGCSRACTFDAGNGRDMQACTAQAELLADRVAKLIALRKAERAKRKIAVALFNFPPNAGNVGTAACLSVFESLHNTLVRLKQAGYTVDVPSTVDGLRDRILKGNAERYGTPANVHVRIPAADIIRRERHLKAIETQWGPAPGKQQSDGGSVFVLGASFGNVFVGVQPAFGYEGDPMRLLFEKGFAPTHAFAAFYRYLREDFGAHAILHFGTHGALEFMPGKQVGLSDDCWPQRLIRDLPNVNLYAANNPSEGILAKRRGSATLISHMTPPVMQAGLYRGLLDLKASLDRWRTRDVAMPATEAEALVALIQTQAAAVDLAKEAPDWLWHEAEERIAALVTQVIDLEHTLIPHGLHVVGKTMPADQRAELLSLMAETASPEVLRHLDQALQTDAELDAVVHALDGGYIRPAPGGDLLRNPEMLPTGRNIHGFDPYRMPSVFAMREGEKQAAKLLARHMDEGNALPESVALVLWGTDNLKSEGGPIAQALALLGARARFDGYGKLCGAELIPLASLGRPRVDVVMTLSGIFRDLLPLQTRLLAEAAFLAASADEPETHNFVRKHALAYQARHGCDLETAALRVFSNGDGAYGSNVNLLIDNGRWDDEDELAETFSRRKCFAFNRKGDCGAQPELMKTVLAGVDLAYQNLDSVELGVTTIDQYFDTLGGITRSIKRASGRSAPVYISDQTRGEGKVRTLGEQVSLETRTRALNPKWYEGMLSHGYEGVRHIEACVTNTMGWSATTGQVEPWVYQRLTQTFVLDEAMRKRLADLNPTAAARMVNRLNEAHERSYWTPDAETLNALRQAGDELEDRLEGVHEEIAA
jgi:magnesium chelatase subunit H